MNCQSGLTNNTILSQTSFNLLRKKVILSQVG